MPLPFPPAGYSEDVSRRVRVLFAGHFIVDVPSAKLVWERPFYPVYYVPFSAIQPTYLRPNGTNSNGDQTYDLVISTRESTSAVTHIQSGVLKDYAKISFDAVDAWFEEDERMYGHPKDPYKRIQILQSSKHVRVEIDGVEVANTTRPKLLYETGLPVRKYIPHSDVRVDLLKDDPGRKTTCPYKGDASYYIVQTGTRERAGLAWWYRAPLPESMDIRGHIAFYDEKVDVWVDGVKQEQPVTPFS
ncbi:hypothetical protein BDV59DRAFT_102501 [Aspergillus ambiguus]|uniref:DUF427 domain-containing protein n=1 Tax=Aspergillus ambiguus TaxID=176160 RepID=UPI003CCCDCF7